MNATREILWSTVHGSDRLNGLLSCCKHSTIQADNFQTPKPAATSLPNNWTCDGRHPQKHFHILKFLMWGLKAHIFGLWGGNTTSTPGKISVKYFKRSEFFFCKTYSNSRMEGGGFRLYRLLSLISSSDARKYFLTLSGFWIWNALARPAIEQIQL